VFRRELERKVTHIVRRTVRTRARRTVLDRRILAEADRLATDSYVDQDWLVARVARRICEAVVERLGLVDEGQAARETIRH
jgi:hypothetical protein